MQNHCYDNGSMGYVSLKLTGSDFISVRNNTFNSACNTMIMHMFNLRFCQSLEVSQQYLSSLIRKVLDLI